MQYKMTIAIFILILSGYWSLLNAQEILTWEDCVKETIKNNPDLLSAQQKVKQAEEKKTIAISNYLPSIGVNISGNKNLSKDTTSNSYGLGIQQLLFDGFKTCNNIKQAEQEVELAKLDLAIISSNIRLKLRKAFIELLKSQELVNLTKEIVDRRRQNYELVNMRYQAGLEHKGSVLTAKANYSQAKYELEQAQRSVMFSQRQLGLIIGKRDLTEISVKGDFSLTCDKEKPNFEILVNNNPQMKKIFIQKELARIELESAKSAFYPKINASGNIGGSSSDWSFSRYDWSLGVSLSLPLYEGGSRIATLRSSEIYLSQVEADERSKYNDIILNLENAWLRFINAVDNISIQKEFLDASNERVKITEAQYSNGLVSFDNWTIIEDDLVRVKKSFLNAEAEALSAEADWINAKGGELNEK
jgi:outer membrane protein TolC